MSEEERNKLIKGLEWAEYETLKMKAMRGEMILQDNEKGEIIRVPAREVFMKLYNEPAPTF